MYFTKNPNNTATPTAMDPMRSQPKIPPMPPALPVKPESHMKPDIVAQSVPKQPVLPVSVAADDVIFRTMQNDLADLSNKSPVTHAVSLPGPVAPVSNKPISSVNAPIKPLPARSPGNSSSQKVVFMPQNKHRYSGQGVYLFVGIFSAVLLAIGVFAWLFFKSPGSIGSHTAVADVLPAQAAVIMQYNIDSAATRTDLLNLWSAKTSSANNVDLLRGDPRILLQNPNISEFYYIILADDPRPYLVLEKNSETDKLFSTNGDVKAAVIKGWYVTHSVATDPYVQAVSQSTWATDPNASFFEKSAEGSFPIKVAIGAKTLLQLREGAAGTDFANGNVQGVLLGGRVANGGLELAGKAEVLTSLPAGNNDQQLLSLVPAKTSFVHAGADFATDVQAWSKNTNGFDKAVLDQPQVQALAQQLNTPYVFYSDENDRGVRSYALIIELSEAMRGKVMLGDTSLETGLSGLVKMLSGGASGSQFSFSSGSYLATALKYLNVSGSTSAIDYTVTRTNIFVATSKEAMFSLLDTAVGGGDSLSNSGNFQKLLAAWGAVPVGRDLVLGNTLPASLRQLLPLSDPTSNNVLFGLSFAPNEAKNSASVQGYIQLVAANPASSPQPQAIVYGDRSR